MDVCGRTVRELAAGETHLAAAALLELRPHLASAEALVAAADAQRADGYRVVASFDESAAPAAAAAAGFRVVTMLAHGTFLYVDDLVCRAALRRRGHAAALMDWLRAEAVRLGCASWQLDSGVQAERADAHRLYFASGMRITSYHFGADLPAA